MTEANPFLKKSLLTVSAVLVVMHTGCASISGPELVNKTRPDAQLMVDTEFCRVEGEAKLPKPEVSHPSVELTGLAALITIFERRSLERQHQADLNTFINECLRTKGWTPK
jgi:hypothetical protein